MNTFLRNTTSKLYNAVSAPVAATQDELTERQQSVRDSASLLYNRMVENMGYGPETLKDIVEKKGEEGQQHEEEVGDWIQKFDPCLGLRILINVSYYENVLRWIREIPGHLKTQVMCEEAVWIEPRSLAFVPHRLKSKGLCIKAVRRNPYALNYVPDHLKTQKICKEAMRENPATFFSCT